MKIGPVLLVLLILSGFYLLSTSIFPAAGTLSSLLHTAAESTVSEPIQGPLGKFNLTVANAAPSFDPEEQQNIGVYKRGLPSVVNITSTQVAYDFFYRGGAAAGPGLGLHPRQARPHPHE